MQGLLSKELVSKSSIFGSAGGSNIKSIQRGLSYVGYNTMYADVSITPVDLTKTVLIFSANSENTGLVGSVMVSGAFLNQSTVRFLRKIYSSYSGLSIAWQVVEFNNVKSVQSGSCTVNYNGGNANTVTISAVNSSKAILFFSADSYQNSAYAYYATVNGNITSNTTIGFYSLDEKTVYWFVVEFE